MTPSLFVSPCIKPCQNWGRKFGSWATKVDIAAVAHVLGPESGPCFVGPQTGAVPYGQQRVLLPLHADTSTNPEYCIQFAFVRSNAKAATTIPSNQQTHPAWLHWDCGGFLCPRLGHREPIRILLHFLLMGKFTQKPPF